MARLAVLTDRLPSDTDWKGAHIWRLILALAESHHEVTVFTPLDPALIDCEHPRLNIARPADSWRLDRLLPWLQALMSFKPEVIHTFAPRPNSTWPTLTIWPYLNSAFQMLPDVQRVCTLFEAADLTEARAAGPWLKGAHRWTLFSQSHRAALGTTFRGDIEIAPIENHWPALSSIDDAKNLNQTGEGERHILIPAPVSTWRQPAVDLCLLADFLQHNKEVNVEILGGWGAMTSAQKREGWEILSSVTHQIRLSPLTDFTGLQKKIAEADAIWLRTLAPETWVCFVSQQLAEQYQKPVYGVKMQLTGGSTANFMSRLYTNS